MIFITHDMGVVAEIADRVLVMRRGEQVEQNRVRELFAAPQQAYTGRCWRRCRSWGDGRSAAAGEVSAAGRRGDTAPQDTVPPGAAPILRVEHLVTRFDLRGGLFNRVTRRVHAVENVSFDLYPGETLGLVGESGCGKSTTGRSLLKLVDSQSGTITFAGRRIDQLKGPALQHLRRDIQFIFQDPYASLDPRLTVGFSIMEPLLVHNVMRGREAEQRVAWLLERVGLLPEHARRYPHEFSGGQRQRICIARALALNPKVVIADEAVSALDVSIQAQIVNLLLDLQREFGIAFLFISHDMAVVERISHRVAVMYLGQIVEIGPRQAVFDNPQHPYTRKLMAAVPVADPAHAHKRQPLPADEIPSPVRALGDEPLPHRWCRLAPGTLSPATRSPVLLKTSGETSDMKHTFKRNALLAAVLLAAGTGPVWAAKDAVIAVASNFTTLDPYDANDTLSQAVAKSFYQGLFGFDKDMKLVNVLADSYEVSKDGLTYTVKLRQGLNSTTAPRSTPRR